MRVQPICLTVHVITVHVITVLEDVGLIISEFITIRSPRTVAGTVFFEGQVNIVFHFTRKSNLFFFITGEDGGSIIDIWVLRESRVWAMCSVVSLE